ncbi:MAG: matrixin family metalloprotease [Caldilineaceae bacterium]
MSINRFGLIKLSIIALLLLLNLLLGIASGEPKRGVASEEQPLLIDPLSEPWSTLLMHADLVVRGHVVSTHSAWNRAHTLIETDNFVALHYALLHVAPQQLTVHTLGGLLSNEDLGMASSDTVMLAPEAEVLLFLARQGDHYQLVDGEAGAYLIQHGMAVNGGSGMQIPIRTLVQSLAQAITKQGGSVHLPADWQSLEATMSARSKEIAQDFVYKGYKWPGASPVVKYKVNINSDQAGGANGSVEDFRNAIIAAANTWSQVTNIDFKFQYDGETTATSVGVKSPGLNGINEVIFMHQGITNTAGLGIYFFRKSDNTLIEGDVWLNDDYHWDATGSPASNELDVQSGALHELGHLLNLGHASDESSIMYAYLTSGTLKRILAPDDIAGIRFIYPCTSNNCVAVTAPTATPTDIATLEPRPTIVPTETTTPTPQSNMYLPLVTK